METTVLGIDIGTSSVKVAVVTGSCRLLQSVSHVTNADVPSSIGSKGREQDIGAICRTLVKCVGELSLDVRRSVCRLCFTGQMHGIVLWHTSSLPSYLHDLVNGLEENRLVYITW